MNPEIFYSYVVQMQVSPTPASNYRDKGRYYTQEEAAKAIYALIKENGRDRNYRIIKQHHVTVGVRREVFARWTAK